MGDGAKLEDSNCAGIGGDADHEIRKAAAETEEAWKGCGQKPGVEIWRIEKFQVHTWPEEQYGKFYSGDSYIILLTTKHKDNDALHWDIFFLLGKDSSQDEMGTAAYKTVELDDFLDRQAHQHREVQDSESREFHAIFPAIHYLEGGIESGFHHVEREKFETKMMQVRREKHTTKVTQVTLHKDSMNEGDCFIVDAGETIFKYEGPSSDPFERNRCGVAAENISDERDGRARVFSHLDDEDTFWKHLGGKGPIKAAEDEAPRTRAATTQSARSVDLTAVLFQMSVDDSGTISFAEAGRSGFKDLLNPAGVFFLDADAQVFVWVGKEACQKLGSAAMQGAMKYVHDSGRPFNTPIKLFRQGKIINNTSWKRIMNT